MRTILRLALAAALLSTLFPLGADAEQVNNWSEGSNYPSRITAIPIGSNKLTPNNPVRVGTWTVSFTRQPAIAKYESDARCSKISTWNGQPDEGLVCSNPIVGSVACAFVALLSAGCQRGDGHSGPACYFIVYTNDAPFLTFPCPSSLGLN